MALLNGYPTGASAKLQQGTRSARRTKEQHSALNPSKRQITQPNGEKCIAIPSLFWWLSRSHPLPPFLPVSFLATRPLMLSMLATPDSIASKRAFPAPSTCPPVHVSVRIFPFPLLKHYSGTLTAQSLHIADPCYPSPSPQMPSPNSPLAPKPAPSTR